MLVASQRSSRPGHTIEIGSPTLGTVMSCFVGARDLESIRRHKRRAEIALVRLNTKYLIEAFIAPKRFPVVGW